MSNGLTLPFQKRQDSTVDLFSITCTSGGGRGLFGASFGTDRFGDAGTGVFGESDVGQGVYGQSQSSEGVFGQSESGPGVRAFSRKGVAIWASTNGDTDALYATTSSPHHAGVSANNTSNGDGTVPSGFALWAKANATAIYGEGTPAGYFKGDVLVTGDLVLVNPSSGDIAEDFDVEDEQINLEPGTVLTINDDGKLCASNRPYDTRVAGVVSGGGELKPAVVLQRVSSSMPRSPIALLGKVFCKVDASSGRVAAGDLLTTSGRLGYAMVASDRSRALGAILGNALASLSDGLGMIPVLVSLR